MNEISHEDALNQYPLLSNYIHEGFPTFDITLPNPLNLVNDGGDRMYFETGFLIQTGTDKPFYCEGYSTCMLLLDQNTVRVIGPEWALVSYMEGEGIAPEKWKKWAEGKAQYLDLQAPSLADDPTNHDFRFEKVKAPTLGMP